MNYIYNPFINDLINKMNLLENNGLTNVNYMGESCNIRTNIGLVKNNPMFFEMIKYICDLPLTNHRETYIDGCQQICVYKNIPEANNMTNNIIIVPLEQIEEAERKFGNNSIYKNDSTIDILLNKLIIVPFNLVTDFFKNFDNLIFERIFIMKAHLLTDEKILLNAYFIWIISDNPKNVIYSKNKILSQLFLKILPNIINYITISYNDAEFTKYQNLNVLTHYFEVQNSLFEILQKYIPPYIYYLLCQDKYDTCGRLLEYPGEVISIDTIIEIVGILTKNNSYKMYDNFVGELWSLKTHCLSCFENLNKTQTINYECCNAYYCSRCAEDIHMVCNICGLLPLNTTVIVRPVELFDNKINFITSGILNISGKVLCLSFNLDIILPSNYTIIDPKAIALVNSSDYDNVLFYHKLNNTEESSIIKYLCKNRNNALNVYHITYKNENYCNNVLNIKNWMKRQ